MTTAPIDPHEIGDPAPPVGPSVSPEVDTRSDRSDGRLPVSVTALVLGGILLIGAALRLVGGNWDDGAHIHPDERFLTMVEGALEMPQDLLGYFDTDTNPLNPRNRNYGFFVYGSWPITLVHTAARALDKIEPPPPPDVAESAPADTSADLKRALAQALISTDSWPPSFTSYSAVNLIGRRMMALFDVLALALIFVLGSRLYDRRVGLLAAGLAAFTAFAIQQAHFFTVDSAANFFVVLALVGYAGIQTRRRPIDLVVAGLGLGMALASKVSVWPLVPLGVIVLAFAYGPRREADGDPEQGAHEGGANAGRSPVAFAIALAILGIVSFLSLRVTAPDIFAGPGWPNVVADPARYQEVTARSPGWWFELEAFMPDSLEPYVLPDPRWAQNMQEVRGMITGTGMDWPPNHQWWNRVPYWFPLKNMLLWGMGLPLGIAAWAAWGVAGWQLVQGRTRHLIPWLWIAIVFAYQGIQWVKTMRYFLPIYPTLALLAAWGLVALWDRASARDALRARVAGAVLGIVIVGTVIWGLMVTSIYTRPHPRVAGTEWIYHNIPTAFSLQLQDDDWKYLPVNTPPNMELESDQSYVVGSDRSFDLARVLVPGEQPRTVTGLLARGLSDPQSDDSPERIRVAITTRPETPDRAPEAVIAEGETEVRLEGGFAEDVVVPLPATVLEPDGEYYVHISFAGAPIRGELPILAMETRWDDAIPFGKYGYSSFDDASTPFADGLYGSVTLELYDADDPGKVDRIVTQLEQSDYIVVTSNRVYGSVAQLPTRYPMTLKYYEMLWSGALGFEQVAEITSYPSLGRLQVPDQAAEEAWTVYDHPKVDIYRKTDRFDPAAVRASLLPMTDPGIVTWTGPETHEGGGLAGAVLALLPGAAEEAQLPDVMLSPERFQEQLAGGTWSDIFSLEDLLNTQPALAVVAWYLALLAVGLLAFPIVAVACRDLPDRGWAVARAAGLLLVSYLAWLVSSISAVPHRPGLVAAAAVAVAIVSGVALYLQRHDLRRWARANARLLVAEEVLFAVLFLVFLGIRMSNPDLWHPYYGGEKPMDFAYLNATLRSVSFPPYDPWYAGGQMNYYYYGFVFVGALIELTGIVPWIAYNLIIPSLAAMTGLGIFGAVFAWSRGIGRTPLVAGAAGVLGATLAVISGNLYQVKFIATKLAELSPLEVVTAIPGVETTIRAADGWLAVLRDEAGLAVSTGDWYWKASRAIATPSSDVEPITEFPFFTFLYADLHAHMMALPITVLALVLALSWPLGWARRLGGCRPEVGLVRLGLLGLAVGALWPANTWDYPTYGLVAAGAIAVAGWGRRPGVNLAWLSGVAIKGLALLTLSLVLFLPYHSSYVQPYGEFGAWQGAKTAVDSYLIVHGIFLFAIVSWGWWRLAAAWPLVSAREGRRDAFVASALVVLVVVAVLVYSAAWTALAAALVVVAGLALALRPGAVPAERFAGFIVILGVILTLFVEYVVLQGDIGRMNTVFKFYIQVWVLWSAVAAVGVAWLVPHLRRVPWGGLWWGVFTLLVASGLVYPVTAARAKAADRFPAAPGMPEQARLDYDENLVPALSGLDYESYAWYDDDGSPLELAADRDAAMWMLENIEGTPVILEGYRVKAYRWGSRFSIHTGFPAVIGWDWHQKQQKNAVGHSHVDQRTTDVATMYNTPDPLEARALLDHYRVEYVIVGEMEKAFYDPEGLAKFAEMAASGDFELVYGQGAAPVQIYRVVRQDDSGLPPVPGLTEAELRAAEIE